MEIVALQNESGWSNNKKPTIVITPDMPEWERAYQEWLVGKNPTDSSEWKKGVYAICQ